MLYHRLLIEWSIIILYLHKLNRRKYCENYFFPSLQIFIIYNSIRLISANKKELYNNYLRLKTPVL